MSAKEAVLDVLKHAPADASFEELQYRIYIREKLERGLEAIEQGNLVTSDKVDAEMRKWSIG